MEKKGATSTVSRESKWIWVDCPVCFEPLSPPILQCGLGHVLCSTCRAQVTKCPLCSGTAFQRCFTMERVVESVVVPCSFVKDGCTQEIAYLNKIKYEKTCRYGQCFCLEFGCNFTGPATALLDHFTTHKWPSTPFRYYKQFDLMVRPGPHVLHAQNQDGRLFLVNMEPAEPVGYTICIVCIQPNAVEYYSPSGTPSLQELGGLLMVHVAPPDFDIG